ncbi:MAG: hydroxyphenylacetyl-CoA thioesterase PaaI [Burkholderiales bacterium]
MSESIAPATSAAQLLAEACGAAIMRAEPVLDHYGMTLVAVGPGTAHLECTVRADMVNQQNVCHGGVLVTLADSALGIACNSYNERTLSSNAAIEFLLPANIGERLIATACEQSRGKRSGVYDVRVESGAGKLIALLRGRTVTVGGPVIPP